MKKVIIFSLLFLAEQSFALIPIEGILLGKADEEKQYDPLLGILNKRLYTPIKNKRERYYRGLYFQGISLKAQCDQNYTVEYKRLGQAYMAKRSVVGTLQYIGLDLSLRAIISYAKKLEMSESVFNKLADNIVTDSCNPNLTVYGNKLIRDNFKYYWNNPTNFELPTLKGSNLFGNNLGQMQNQKRVIQREFEYTLRNFRAFCSWNGDVENYGLIVPYLKDPFIMSYVFNNILRREISSDAKTEELSLIENKDGVQVVCRDLMCRRVPYDQFLARFPKMLGSISLENDLTRLYCGHFSTERYRTEFAHPRLKKWIEAQTDVTPLLESGQFLALITGVPEVVLSIEKYSEVAKMLKKNIEDQWKEWAEKKVAEQEYNIFYEESLRLELQDTEQDKIAKGEFEINFRVTLGEMDLILNDVDKIDSQFDLILPKKQLNIFLRTITYWYNKGEYKKEQEEITKFERYLEHILSKKSQFFQTPLWDKRIIPLIRESIVTQITNYNGRKLKTLSGEMIKIPVRFEYGLFALKYMHEKYQQRLAKEKLLTYRK